MIDEAAEPADVDSLTLPAPVRLPQVQALPQAQARLHPAALLHSAVLPQVGEGSRNDGPPSKRTRITHERFVIETLGTRQPTRPPSGPARLESPHRPDVG